VAESVYPGGVSPWRSRYRSAVGRQLSADPLGGESEASVTLEDVLEAVRDHYIALYREAIASYRQKFTPSAAEVLLETEGERPLVYRLYRMDLASGAVDPPNLTEVNPSTHLDFEAFRADRDGLAILVSPIVWNGVEFRAQPSLANDDALRSWALRWIDPEERAEADSDGLGAYVHSITIPENEAGATSLSVDFGSAPSVSVLEFLEVLRESGAESIEMHSRAILDQ